MEKSKEKRTCAGCKYYEECVKGIFGNIPALFRCNEAIKEEENERN